MVGITFDYNIALPDRKYTVGETIEHNGERYIVRDLGNRLVYLVPQQNE
jgi:hypothetical protein